MPESTAGRSDRPTQSPLALFVATSLGWFATLLALRAYEFWLVRGAHALPAGTGTAELHGILADLELALVTAAVLALPVLGIARWWPVAANRVHRAVLAVLAVAAVALAQYFAVTFVPLGADFFGYSPGDIASTAMSSKGVGVVAILALVVAAALSWVLTGVAGRIRLPSITVGLFGAVSLVACAVPAVLTPARSTFGSDAAWFLAQNKTAGFAAGSARHFGWFRSRDGGPEPTGFPLMRAATYDDVLGPMMRAQPASPPPNFVFIVVEGLGRDFVGDGARFGGFTPFLDSLAKRSLVWDNFVSVSGRTFGVLPALLGSLPYGDAGFMDLRGNMPPHLTLVRLLRERGYTANYFTGTDGHFDFIDTFLEYQGIDHLIDQSKFGAGYEKQPAGEGGFSWGYPDDALFRRSLEVIGTGGAKPRLDVYLTITTHEPFIPPGAARWSAEFERRLAALRADSARKAEVRSYAGVFTTLLYTDDAIRQFLAAYARRPEFARTIFVITGDHRLIPIPAGDRIDRYRVPFIVYSPMLAAPRRIAAVSSHLDVTPSLLALLHRRYGMTFPDSVAWLGTGLDTARQFRVAHPVALMRTKNGLDEWLEGDHFLSGDQLFRVTNRLGLDQTIDDSLRDALGAKLARFRTIDRYVTHGPHLLNAPPALAAALREASREDSLFGALRLARKTPTEAFVIARDAALRREFETARLIARRLLRDAPGFHDARALLGRTYGWENRFDDARPILEDLVRRAPDYADGRLALIDLERWAGQFERSVSLADSALRLFPADTAIRHSRDLAREALAKRGRPPVR